MPKTSSQLSQAQKRQFRTIGHQLKPVVSIGDAGLSENVEKELDRALEDHELIKVKIPAGDKSFKDQLITEMCEKTESQLVQQVGKIALIYRAAKKAKPKLSNILKFENL